MALIKLGVKWGAEAERLDFFDGDGDGEVACWVVGKALNLAGDSVAATSTDRDGVRDEIALYLRLEYCAGALAGVTSAVPLS